MLSLRHTLHLAFFFSPGKKNVSQFCHPLSAWSCHVFPCGGCVTSEKWQPSLWVCFWAKEREKEGGGEGGIERKKCLKEKVASFFCHRIYCARMPACQLALARLTVRAHSATSWQSRASDKNCSDMALVQKVFTSLNPYNANKDGMFLQTGSSVSGSPLQSVQ